MCKILEARRSHLHRRRSLISRLISAVYLMRAPFFTLYVFRAKINNMFYFDYIK